MTRVIVIPARLRSTRLPRKVLLDTTGWPLVRHVYERCRLVPDVDRVVVATDSEIVADVVQAFGGEAVLTCEDLPSGTDRVAAALRELGLLEDASRDSSGGLAAELAGDSAGDSPGDDLLVVNVQGDEPRIDPDHIGFLFRLLAEDCRAQVATLAVLRTDRLGFEDPNRVKVVLDADGYALYFSRAMIPFPRDAQARGSSDEVAEDREAQVDPWLCHLGIYGFRPPALLVFTATPPGVLEQRERLEQLRFLEWRRSIPKGRDHRQDLAPEGSSRIRVGIVDHAAPGIDTPSDYEEFVQEWRRQQQ